MPPNNNLDQLYDRKRTVTQLRAIMAPHSIAIVGASSNPMKEGTRIVQNLLELGFKNVYPINPSATEILGLPVYRSIEDVPHPIDLVTIIIPPQAVPEILRQCARIGVKGVIIRTEGFAETGETGKQLQNTLQEIIKDADFRVFGPNTTGILNSDSPAFTTSTFVDAKKWRAEEVGVGWIAQTGMFAGAILRHIMSNERFGISKVLGLGNKIDVDEADGLYYLAEDDSTKVISMYLEAVTNGRRFLHAARTASAKKPVVILKSGKTQEGAIAALSHTASLVGDYQIFETAAKQAGVVLVDSFQELVDVSKAFIFQPLPIIKSQSCRVAILGFSGAFNILATDFLIQAGLQLATFSDKTMETLMSIFTNRVKAANPIDSYPDAYRIGSERVFKVVLGAMLADPQVDAIYLASYVAENMDFRPEYIIQALGDRNSLTKPIITAVVGEKENVDATQLYLEDHQIPTYMFPVQALNVLAKMDIYARYRAQLEQKNSMG